MHLHQNPYPHILFLPPLLPTTGDSSFFQVSDEIFRYSRPALTLRAGKASFILYNILRSIGFGCLVTKTEKMRENGSLGGFGDDENKAEGKANKNGAEPWDQLSHTLYPPG